MTDEATEEPTAEQLDELQARMAPPVDDRDDQTLTQWAMEWVTGTRFVTTELQEMLMSFPVFALMQLDQIPRNMVAATEHISQAGPRSVNGLPMFFSMSIVTENDLPILCEKAEQFDRQLHPERYEGDDHDG